MVPLFLKKQKTILSAASLIGTAFLASAFLGLLRDRLLASYFGASPELGLFFAADRVPSFLFNLLVIGALSPAFIPVFTRLISQGKEETAWKVTSSVINLTFLIFLFLGSLIFLAAYPISNFVTLYKLTPPQVSLMANLTRIMLSVQFIFIFSSFFISILQSFRRFFIPALAPVVYNLGIILGVIFLSFPLGIFAPALGMVFGASLHLLIQLPLVKKLGFRHFFSFDFFHPEVKEIIRLAIPQTLGLGASQLVLLTNTALAATISPSSLVVLNFALHLQNLPVSLFGLSMAQALLPTLSYFSAKKNNFKSLKKTFLTSLHQMLFLALPISVILVVLRIPVVRLVFGAKRFPWEATVLTGYTLAFFSLSIFAQCLVYLLSRAFYSLHDTSTPVKVNIFSVLLNIFLAVFFTQKLNFGVWSLALSFSLAYLLNALLLLYFLDKRVGHFLKEELFLPFVKISYASFLMGVSLYIPMKLLDRLVLDTTRTINLIILTGIASFCGITVYFFLTKLFKVSELEIFWKLLGKLPPLRKD